MLKTSKKRFLFLAISMLFVVTMVVTVLAQEPVEGSCTGSAPPPGSSTTCWATVAWIINQSSVEQATKSGTSSCHYYCSTVRTSCWAEGDGVKEYLTGGA